MKTIFSAMFIWACATSYAQILTPNSAELKQLEAMGYETKVGSDVDSEEGTAIAWTGSAKIILSKNAERTIVFRMFTREKKLKPDQEIELLKLVNMVNTQSSYQVSVEGEYLNVALYDFGPYNTKTFAKLIRHIENSNLIFDKYPRLKYLLR